MRVFSQNLTLISFLDLSFLSQLLPISVSSHNMTLCNKKVQLSTMKLTHYTHRIRKANFYLRLRFSLIILLTQMSFSVMFNQSFIRLVIIFSLIFIKKIKDLIRKKLCKTQLNHKLDFHFTMMLRL